MAQAPPTRSAWPSRGSDARSATERLLQGGRLSAEAGLNSEDLLTAATGLWKRIQHRGRLVRDAPHRGTAAHRSVSTVRSGRVTTKGGRHGDRTFGTACAAHGGAVHR